MNVLPNIPPELYAERPLLKELRTQAHRRGAPADAVLWSYLVMAAADIPAKVSIETGIGTPARPTLYAVLAGASGAGKSAAWSVARSLYGGAEPFPLSTGEGMIEAFYGKEPEDQTMPDGKVKRVYVRKRVRSNALFWLDEGETLFRQMERPGNVVGPVLRSFWSGGTVGQANATEGLSRALDAGTYTGGLVVGLQPDISGKLLADTAAGTAQRFVWTSSTDVHASDDLGDGEPITGPLDRPRPPVLAAAHPSVSTFMAGALPVTPRVFMTVDPSVARGLWVARGRILRGEEAPSEHDSQRPVMRVKVAGVLAWLDGRLHVTSDDWELAGGLLSASDAVRDVLLEHAEEVTRAGHADEGTKRAQIRLAEVSAEGVRERCADRVAELLKAEGVPISRSVLTRWVSRPQRPFLGDVLEVAEELGVIRSTTGPNGSRHYTWTGDAP